ncbi:SEA/GATOR complex protein SEA3/WDR59, partial [Lecanoromycetidae sp. Uapishka_2]
MEGEKSGRPVSALDSPTFGQDGSFRLDKPVKWNRQNSHILASSHDKFLRIWDDRKGALPLCSIEAHNTKIYGVDWNRTETTKLMTCSLDRTIKLWDYEKGTDGKQLHEPDRILRTPFPVWRARYTPFGFGLLAMPQRGDYDLHLYDRRQLEPADDSDAASAVHHFGGHENQVKEFLWRPRGNVTDNIDDREFQLVSWGTDRILRLHQVDEDVLGRVGFEKGVNRNFNVTRKNAVYKTFRNDPSKNVQASLKDSLPTHSPRSTITNGMSRAPVPFIGGYGNGGFMSSAVGRKTQSPKEMDPISWMQGVKIGKRGPSPSGMHQSISSIASPSLKIDPSWDVFEHLGEEITHVDVQRRRIVVSLNGPWGPEKGSTYIKAIIVFPSLYPDAAPPSVCLENTASIDESVESTVLTDLKVITNGFVSRQRSSLEPVLRYLLGEQSVEESLLWLEKRHESVDLDPAQDLDLSSSDEDDDPLGSYSALQANVLEVSDPQIAVSNAQYNVPLPKACGALWADNGRLVCFFPPKPEKEPSLLDMSLKSVERASRYRKTIFEGFGRLQSASRRQKRAASTLETIESGDSDLEDSLSSSSSSSSSNETGLVRHHFMPSMAWRGDSSDLPTGATIDESQKSSDDSKHGKSAISKGTNFVSIHDLSDLLPATLRLARKYSIGTGTTDLSHNAQVAKEEGDLDLADVWSFVDLLLQHKVPLELMQCPPSNQSIAVIARRAVSSLKNKDSAIDLSFDAEEDRSTATVLASVKWGSHPFGRWRFVDCL